MAIPPEPPRSSIAAIVDYNWADEERDYAACEQEGNEQAGHIFEHLKRVSGWLAATNATLGEGGDAIGDAIGAADRVASAHDKHGVLACLDDEVRDAVLLVCGTIAQLGREPTRPRARPARACRCGAQQLVPERMGAADWLLAIHRMLFPERYPRDLQPDHVYWEQAADDPDAAEPFEWDSETIEWVATMLEQAVRTHPDARLKP